MSKLLISSLMKKSFISTVLKRLMFQNNINVSQLARETKLPQQTLQRLVAGLSNNPHKKTVDTLADFFGLTHAQLKGETILPKHLDNQLLANTQPAIQQIPILSWDDIEHYLKNPKKTRTEKFILTNSGLSEKQFALSMNDSSMHPNVPENSTLIFEPSKPIKDRALVLVKLNHNNTIVFRQLLLDGDLQYLKPFNQDLNTFTLRKLGKKDKILAVLCEYRYSLDFT